MRFQRKDLSASRGTLKAPSQQSPDAFSTRLTQLGPISLASLFVGGWVLILTAFNVLLASQYGLRGVKVPLGWRNISPFAIGHMWSVQIWLAIIGVGLGLVSHGFQEAYMHLFDWWCSRKAHTDAGLDYGRYLNTQPRAPVTYGIRGFPAFASLRYLLSLTAVAASIGYKFGIFEPEVAWIETLSPDMLTFIEPCSTQLIRGGVISPWYMDNQRSFADKQTELYHDPDDIETGGAGNVGFVEWEDGVPSVWALDPTEPPKDLALVADFCFQTNPRSYRQGYIFSREIIVAASMREEEGNFTMTWVGGDDEWHRVLTMSSRWFNESGDRAVVEYRAPEPGKVQVQWAKFGPWAMADEGEAAVAKVPSYSAPVARRVIYDMHFVVAEVQRFFNSDSMECIVGSLASTYPIVLSEGRGAFPRNGSQDDDSVARFLQYSGVWIDAQLAAKDTSVFRGIQAIIRPYMFKWASEDIAGVTEPGSACPSSRWWATEEAGGQFEGGEFLRILTEEEHPYGYEDDRLRSHQELEYPYYKGGRSSGVTGCHYAAAGCFLAIGIAALGVLAIRVLVGPAKLTSWTGQHVYLSQTGSMPILKGMKDLASGYRVAPTGLGELHLGREVQRSSDSDQEGSNVFPPAP